MKIVKVILGLIVVLTGFAHLAYTRPVCKKQLRVALIDTGLDLSDPRLKGHLCKTGHRDLTNTSINDTEGHGTFVAGLIEKYAGDTNYCIIIYKFFVEEDAPGVMNTGHLFEAYKYALQDKVDIINYSGGGLNPSKWEKEMIRSHPEIKFVVAAGNETRDLDNPNGDKFYPASYNLPNITAVGCMHDKKVCKFSNYGSVIHQWEDGLDVEGMFPLGQTGKLSGTSMSTGIATGKLIARTLRGCRK